MAHFEIADAKAEFAALIQRALRGEEVIISRDSQPVLRLVPVRQPGQTRIPGTAKGMIWLAPDFDATPEDFKDYI